MLRSSAKFATMAKTSDIEFTAMSLNKDNVSYAASQRTIGARYSPFRILNWLSMRFVNSRCHVDSPFLN
jgi:hypothetical protein